MSEANGWGGAPRRLGAVAGIKNLHPLEHSMAQKYRFTRALNSKTVTTAGSLCFRLSPLDGEQAPGARLESVKISVIPTDQQTNNGASYMVVASSDTTPGDEDDYITAGAVPEGGGTVWLSIKRTLRATLEADDRNDGPVYIHLFTQGNVPSKIVCESWGRFLYLQEVP